MRLRTYGSVLLCAVFLVAGPSPAAAQMASGRIEVAVTDLTGALLQGVAVEVAGPQKMSAVTDDDGRVHFLHLAPGTYTVTAKRTGFSDYFNRAVTVSTGSSVFLRITLWIAGVATQVQVTNDSPVVDTRKAGTSTNITPAELQNIPSARDPWVVLQSVPGVIVDRTNVGGAESGQQSVYQAKGAAPRENTWNLDGIPITDMSALGSTPTYYDFDMFQDVQVTTGGADVSSPTPGVQLNIVLKSGTNTRRGSTRIFFANESLQSNNLPGPLVETIGGVSGKGNRMAQYYDTGVELGGPLLEDRLWAWGAHGKTHVDLLTLNDAHDRTELLTSSVKANGQVTAGVRATYSFFRGDKQKFGRDIGPTVADESSYDQTGPTTLHKGEGQFVIGNSLFISARAAHVAAGFQLAPRGGRSAQMYVDDAGVTRGSADLFTTDRPQNAFGLDGSAFQGRHELKFGFGWRKASVESSTVFPGNGLISYHLGYPQMLARITRPAATATNAAYTSAYAADSWTRDRLTLSFGARWDRQAASLESTPVPASSVLPSLLPALTAAAVEDAIVWNAVTPRVAVTFALNEEKKTLARASYAAFASQLGATAAAHVSSIQPAAIDFTAVDFNGNRIADPNEILFGLGNHGYYGFDPFDPGRATTLNQIGSYSTPLTQEVMFGVDHELQPHFGLSGTLTFRHFDRFNWRPLIGVTSANYTQTGTLTGDVDPVGAFSTPFYAINANAIPAGGGRSYEERRGYTQRFVGMEVSAVKRLRNGWMARLGFSTNSHREYFAGPAAIEDPTPTPSSPNRDGGTVVTRSTTTGKSNTFMVLPRFQIIANGMYQARWGINVAGNWVIRQGYAMPYFRTHGPTGDPLSNLKPVLLVDDVARFRLAPLNSLDVRVERAFTLPRTTLTLDLDIFNVMNRATTLERQYDARITGATGFNQTLAIMNPRIVRLGARLNF